MNDYYSLLRISPQASKLDIINAYRRAKLTFRKDSLAVYSLYSEEELILIREEVEQAYLVLTDREKRRVYDAEHSFVPDSIDSQAMVVGAEEDARSDELNNIAGEESGDEGEEKGLQWSDNVVRLHRRNQRDYDPELERQIQTAEVFTGSLLREVREYRGVELQDVAEHTRISMAYLKAIENEDVAELPVTAYLKGYVGQYAAEIDLEPHRVVQGYPPLSDKQSFS